MYYCHCLQEDVVKPLLEVTKTALLHDCALLCAWSLEECGRYLETIKVFENKPADLVRGQMDTGCQSRSPSNIMDASMEDLARCPGIGECKVKRLYDTFHEPFKHLVPSHPVQKDDAIEALSDVNSKEASKQRKKELE